MATITTHFIQALTFTDMDAYDEGLDRMIWSLSDQRLRWNEIVAKKRRTAPLQVEELMHSVLERQRQADAEIQGLLDDLPDDETVASTYLILLWGNGWMPDVGQQRSKTWIPRLRRRLERLQLPARSWRRCVHY